MSNGSDWESVMFKLDPDSLQIHEAFVDLISGRVSSTLFGLDFVNGRVVEREYSDNGSDYEDRKDKKEFCGVQRNLLDHGPARFRSPRLLHSPYRAGLQQIMHEQAEQNAKELVEEEERLKVKAEKKRLKKSKRKQKKHKGKEKGKENSFKNKDGDHREVDESVKSKFSNNESVNEKSDEASASLSTDTVPAVSLKKTQTSPSSVLSKSNDDGSSEDEDEDEDAEDEEEEEEEEGSEVDNMASELEMLDMNSCFVSKAATIVQRKLEPKAKPEKKEKGRSLQKQEAKQPLLQQQPLQQRGQWQVLEPHQNRAEPQQQQQQQQSAEVASIEDVVKRSTELAVIGNQLGNSGCFDMAVIYFTDAIKHNPKDFRLFGNRSFCYEKMQQYEKALIDADISLAMSPGWIKGLYRRGRALAGLKRYSEAAAAYKELLQRDSSSSDAAQELMRMQIMQLMEMGFSREQSSNALIIHGTVEKALEAFSNIQDEKFGRTTPPATKSAKSEDEWVVAGQKAQPPANQVTQLQTQPISHPRPPVKISAAGSKSEATLGLFPVWVGNLVPSVTESTVRQLFSTAGPIHSVRLLLNRSCAFINYTRKDDCEAAIRKFNGMVLEGVAMSVRYPDRIPPNLGVSAAAKLTVNLPFSAAPKKAPAGSGECFYWRNHGCSKKERCIYKHVPSHKGIDNGKNKPAPLPPPTTSTPTV